MSRETLRWVRDPIHGLIELHPSEWDVIDTPIFQRLRGVQQLAMTHFVYPGARHSRFEHSIGCCDVAGRVAENMHMAEDERQLVRFAALLHDVGHGPFSHVSDAVFGALIDPERKASEVHEHISAAVALHDPQVRTALGEYAEPVANLLAHRGEHADRTLARDIVSGPADIDKLDYLLRDSHYCGVNYGRYDIDKLTTSTVPIEDGRQTYLGYRKSAVYALEEMLLARYHMHSQVYGHTTRIASDLALTRAMILGVGEELLPRAIFSPPTEPDADFVQEYVPWTDSKVIHELLGGPEPSRAKTMMEAVTARRLPKLAVSVNGEQLRPDLTGDGRRWLSSPWVFKAVGPEPAERYLADALGIPADQVFVHVDAQSDPMARPGSYEVEEKDVLLRVDEGYRQIEEESQVFHTRGAEKQLVVSVFIWPLGGEDLEPMGTRARDHLAAAVECAAGEAT